MSVSPIIRNWYGLIMVNAVTNKFASSLGKFLQRPSNKSNSNLNTNQNQVDNGNLLNF